MSKSSRGSDSRSAMERHWETALLELTASQRSAIRQAMSGVKRGQQRNEMLRQAEKYGIELPVILLVMKAKTVTAKRNTVTKTPKRQCRDCPECGRRVAIRDDGILETHTGARKVTDTPWRCPGGANETMGGVTPPAKKAKTRRGANRNINCLRRDCDGTCGLIHNPSPYAIARPDPTGLRAANVKTSGRPTEVARNVRIIGGGLPSSGRRSR